MCKAHASCAGLCSAASITKSPLCSEDDTLGHYLGIVFPPILEYNGDRMRMCSSAAGFASEPGPAAGSSSEEIG